MRLKIPAGQSFTLGNKTYTGLKRPGADERLTVDERKQSLRDKVTTLFSPGYTIPGTDGIPILDSDGYATPEGWKAVIRVSGLDREDFIKQWGYLVSTYGIEKYGLTRPEQELIRGKL